MDKRQKLTAIGILLFLALLISGCFLIAHNHNEPEQQSSASQKQDQMDVRMLQDENKTLKNKLQTLEEQVSNLNETVYQNRKYIEELKEVYRYVAQDNEMPGTGEELPSDQLDTTTN